VKCGAVPLVNDAQYWQMQETKCRTQRNCDIVTRNREDDIVRSKGGINREYKIRTFLHNLALNAKDAYIIFVSFPQAYHIIRPI